MGTHAKLSPSSAERWFNCPGSINLTEYLIKKYGIVSVTNKYAAEGTVAHQLAEDFVMGKVDLLTLTSRVGETVMQDGHEIEITDAMIDGVIEYADHIAATEKRLTKPAPVVRLAEERVVAYEGEVYGTADFVLYQVGHELHVFDFKYGKGVVEAEENKQGLNYVLGVLMGLVNKGIKASSFDKIFFHIVQPRARHNEGSTRPWEIPLARVQEFQKELAAAVERTKDQNAPRAAGPWCKYCPAEAHCPEKAGQLEAAVQAAFTKIPAQPSKEVALAMTFPPVALLTGEQLARVLDHEDGLDSFMQACRDRAQADLARDPSSVPGYKLVEGRANRAWAGPDEVIEDAFAMLGEERYAPRKLKSPAQMEKVAGKEAVEKYTHKPAGKLTVAKASDKRPAATLAPGNAAEVFGVLDVQRAEDAPEFDGTEDIFGDLAKKEEPKALGVGDRRGPLWPV